MSSELLEKAKEWLKQERERRRLSDHQPCLADDGEIIEAFLAGAQAARDESEEE